MRRRECWVCDYCGKLFLSKKNCENHENKYCRKNLFVFSCRDCKNAVLEFNEIGRSKVTGCKAGHTPGYDQFENCPNKNIWS